MLSGGRKHLLRLDKLAGETEVAVVPSGGKRRSNAIRSSLNQFLEQDVCLIPDRELSQRLSSSPSTRLEKLLRNLRAVDLFINGVQAVLLVLLDVLYHTEKLRLRRHRSLSSSSSYSHKIDEIPRL